MLALGFSTRYAGLDATMGLAFASTGVLFPFFSPLLAGSGGAHRGRHCRRRPRPAGHEGEILRYVFWHSIALASLVGVLAD